MKEAFTFDDVVIVPKFSTVASRGDVDISSNFGRLPYQSLPIISANMDTVTGVDMAKAMAASGGSACLHRFQSIEDNVKMFMDSWFGSIDSVFKPMVSIGLGEVELDRALAFSDHGATEIVIDVANGASMGVVNQVKALRQLLGNDVNIIVGNFATGRSVIDFLVYLGEARVDAIKVGIGSGAACTTRIHSGCGYPQLSAIIDVVSDLRGEGYDDIAVISDGGHRTSGDIAKALGAGANLVMLGSMLAGTDESPGELIKLCGTQKVKKYRGSASKESYIDQGKEAQHRAPEGESFMVPYKGPVKDVLQKIAGGLRGSFSTVGACNLEEFHGKVEFVRVTNAGYLEGQAHGKK